LWAIALFSACPTRDHESVTAGGPTLSRRVRSSPPADGHFAGFPASPAVEGAQDHWRVKVRAARADSETMDANGARQLAARIRAGVSIGMRIEIVGEVDDELGLRRGDRGVVDQVDEAGHVLVRWDRGFAREIDPERTPFRRLAA
jgi:hypothetical protein